jgi:cytochrome c oxidase cbb3-type subunit 3
MATTEKDEISGTPTTGHDWDGIKELDTPMPRWWLWTFLATIAWAVVYTILYPAWPLINAATPGLLGFSSRADLAAALQAADAAQETITKRIAAANLEAILADDELRTFAKAAGAAAFKVNCVQCHGSGAAGSLGYPNLNDNDWIWGGTVADIHRTIAVGARYAANPDTRQSEMLKFGADAILTPAQIGDVANFTLALSGGEADAEAATRGAPVYAENCAACHGEKGEGNRELGSPNLADQIWLYRGDLKGIVAQVQKPRHGVMPAWTGRLGDTTIKELAVYVYTLGGGEQAAASP